jgi:hypothetical protein
LKGFRVIIWLSQWNPKPQLYEEDTYTKRSIRTVKWHIYIYIYIYR